MKWIEIRIKTTEEAYDAVSEMLTDIGAGGVAIEDPNDIRAEVAKPNSLDYADDEFLEGLGDDVLIKAYFPDTVSLNELTALVHEKLDWISGFLDVGKGYDGYAEVDEEDWSTAWKKYYKPLKLTERIIIKPSWEAYEKQDSEIVIELDPGMAFGTGTHETTQMCAALLDEFVKPEDRVMDIGCGTGILAIIAVKLGAQRVAALDVDPMAVRITEENSVMNGVSHHIEASVGILQDYPKGIQADIIVANIIASVIVDLADVIPQYLKAGGTFITSGIIRERRDEVIKAYEAIGLSPLIIKEMGEWVGMAFKEV